jgi:hypothetical protein
MPMHVVDHSIKNNYMQGQEGNVAPGQQNYPKGNPAEDNKLVSPKEEIISGAAQVDKLDKLKEAASDKVDSGQQDVTTDTDQQPSS